MSKNLILVQDGFPGSNTSGTVVESLNIKNFFKYEKNVSATTYSRNKTNTDEFPKGETSTTIPNNHDFMSLWTRASNYYEPLTGNLLANNLFKNYSVTFLLFAVRMKKGFTGRDVTITSRLTSDDLSLRFYDIGKTVEDFTNIYKEYPLVFESAYISGSRYNVFGYKQLSNSIVITDLQQYNHCFLAALFSKTAYTMESGTVLLNNEPLLNISWTETGISEAQ